jgi:hypothetical protein
LSDYKEKQIIKDTNLEVLPARFSNNVYSVEDGLTEAEGGRGKSATEWLTQAEGGRGKSARDGLTETEGSRGKSASDGLTEAEGSKGNWDGSNCASHRRTTASCELGYVTDGFPNEQLFGTSRSLLVRMRVRCISGHAPQIVL